MAVAAIAVGIVGGFIGQVVKIYGQKKWDDKQLKLVDKGVKIIEDGANDMKAGCGRCCDRTFQIIKTCTNSILSCAINAGVIGCGFFLNKAAKDELCTKQTEDHLGCQPAQYLSIGLMAYGTLGLIHSAYEARSSNSKNPDDSNIQDIPGDRRNIYQDIEKTQKETDAIINSMND